MPTVNPRVNVTLSPSIDGLVQRFARLTGQSKSQVLRELLEAAEPALQRAAALMEAASKAQGQLLDGLARSLNAAQTKAEQQLAEHLAFTDAATGDLVAQAQAVRGRRRPPGVGQAPADVPGPAKPAAVTNPPASNRGVKSRQGSPKARAKVAS